MILDQFRLDGKVAIVTGAGREGLSGAGRRRQDHQHRRSAAGSATQRGHTRSNPRRTMGRAGGPGRHGRLPGVRCLALLPRRCVQRRRRMAGSLTRPAKDVCNFRHDNMLCSDATAVADREDGHLSTRFPVVESHLRQECFLERRKTHCKLELIRRSQFPLRRDTSNARRGLTRSRSSIP